MAEQWQPPQNQSWQQPLQPQQQRPPPQGMSSTPGSTQGQVQAQQQAKDPFADLVGLF